MAQTPFNAYLKMTPEGKSAIQGSCRTPGHSGKIEVLKWDDLSFQQKMQSGLQAPASVRKAQSTPTKPDDFTFQKYYDRSSDDLIKACWEHTKLSCEFELYRASGQLELAAAGQFFVLLKFENAYIAKYKIDESEDSLPIEKVTLEFTKLTFSYKQLDIVKGSFTDTTHVVYDWTNKKSS